MNLSDKKILKWNIIHMGNILKNLISSFFISLKFKSIIPDCTTYRSSRINNQKPFIWYLITLKEKIIQILFLNNNMIYCFVFFLFVCSSTNWLLSQLSKSISLHLLKPGQKTIDKCFNSEFKYIHRAALTPTQRDSSTISFQEWYRPRLYQNNHVYLLFQIYKTWQSSLLE